MAIGSELRAQCAGRVITAVAAVAFVAGCAQAPRVAPLPDRDPLMEELVVHAAHARHAWGTLVGESAVNRGLSEQVPPATFPLERLPVSLQPTVEMRWHGELEPAVRSLAEFAGWDFHVVGPRPPAPILVMLDSDGDSVGHLLRSLGQQAGSRANVIVRSPARSIELVYR